MTRPITIIISGPSGVGKGTVCNEIKKNPNLTFDIAVSATTREPREGEIRGVSYDFITKEEFEKRIKEGYFAEYNLTNRGTYYGTPVKEIEKAKAANKDLILEIEINGGNQIIDKNLADLTIFITAPIDVIEKRLINRKTEDAEEIQKRIETAKYEVNNHEKYMYEVVNDDLDQCVQEITDLIIKTKESAE